MTFPNGYSGVKKLFIAEILALVSSILIIAAGIAGIAALANLDASADAALALAGGGGVFGLIAGILIIIAAILRLLGLYQAGKDEDAFRKAFLISIFVLIMAVISAIMGAIFGSSSFADDVVSLVQRLANILVIFLVIGGIQSFAESLNNEKMLKRGTKIAWVIAIPYFLSAVAILIPGFFGLNVSTASAAGIIMIIGGILGIIGSLLFLIYLGQGQKMLKEN